MPKRRGGWDGGGWGGGYTASYGPPRKVTRFPLNLVVPPAASGAHLFPAVLSVHFQRRTIITQRAQPHTNLEPNPKSAAPLQFHKAAYTSHTSHTPAAPVLELPNPGHVVLTAVGVSQDGRHPRLNGVKAAIRRRFTLCALPGALAALARLEAAGWRDSR